MPRLGSLLTVALGVWLTEGCGGSTRSEPQPPAAGASDGALGGAGGAENGGGGSDTVDTAGSSGTGEPSGGSLAVAENGVAIPAHDPRNSCEGLGLVISSCDETGYCDAVSCNCPSSVPSRAHVRCSSAVGCVAAVDCTAECALGESADLVYWFCERNGLCESDSSCSGGEHCVKPAGDKVGFCSDGARGTACFADGDCRSGACVVSDDTGVGRCDAGEFCNRSAQCGEKKCALAPDHYVGACSDGAVGSPCSTAADCANGSSCVTAQDDFVTGPLGACSDGLTGGPCAAPGDCAPGLVCVFPQHACYASSLGEPCTKNEDCPDGFCSTDPDQPGCTTGEDGESCAAKSQCKDFCVESRCTTGKAGSPCVEASDCRPGNACLANVCTPLR